MQKMILPTDVLFISDLFQKSNKKLFVVGGAVRDFIDNKIPKDFDLATDSLPDETLNILKPHFKTMEVGKAFGVVVAITEDSEYEIATFRKDESEGRRPDSVSFTTIDKDVFRRDLTINALFYDIQKEEVIDLVGGIEDLKNKVIRTVGNPIDRFREDQLRKLRTIRFQGRLNGTFHRDTYNALKNDPDLSLVSFDRRRNEFLTILKTTQSKEKSIKLLEELNFFGYIFPTLKVNLDKLIISEILEVTMASLLFQNTQQEIVKQMNKLTYTKEEVSTISFLVKLLSLNATNAFEFKKSQNRLEIDNELVEQFATQFLTKKILNAFLEYKITTSGEELEKQGLIGIEIGNKIKELEDGHFMDILRIS